MVGDLFCEDPQAASYVIGNYLAHGWMLLDYCGIYTFICVYYVYVYIYMYICYIILYIYRYIFIYIYMCVCLGKL